MKDLIKEIEKCKLKYEYDGSEFDCKRSIFNEGIGKTINWLEDDNFPYNIITAPKQIKLSELIDKIYETKYSSECYVKAIKGSNGQYKDDYRIRVEYGEGYWGDFDFYIVKGKISSDLELNLPRNEFKWLYELWIAGSEIIDDLEEE